MNQQATSDDRRRRDRDPCRRADRDSLRAPDPTPDRARLGGADRARAADRLVGRGQRRAGRWRRVHPAVAEQRGRRHDRGRCTLGSPASTRPTCWRPRAPGRPSMARTRTASKPDCDGSSRPTARRPCCDSRTPSRPATSPRGEVPKRRRLALSPRRAREHARWAGRRPGGDRGLGADPRGLRRSRGLRLRRRRRAPARGAPRPRARSPRARRSAPTGPGRAARPRWRRAASPASEVHRAAASAAIAASSRPASARKREYMSRKLPPPVPRRSITW